MKKYFSQLLLLLIITISVTAQQNDSLPRGNALQGLKMAFITKQLTLSNEESQKFWPVYFNYMDDLKKARLDHKDDVIAQEEAVLSVRKKYKDEFRKVLNTDDRVSKMLTVDRDFNNVLRKELQQRRQKMAPKKQAPHPVK